MDEYHWDDEDVALQEQPRTAVFLNAGGAVIIRQQNWPDDDQSVLIQPQNVIRIVLAVLAAAGHDDIELVRSFGGGGYEDVEIPSEPPRPRERQEIGFIDAVRTGPPALPDLDQKMAPKDPKAAERQRRRREKHRQRDSVTGRDNHRDTERDAVTVTPLVPELDLDGGQNRALAH